MSIVSSLQEKDLTAFVIHQSSAVFVVSLQRQSQIQARNYTTYILIYLCIYTVGDTTTAFLGVCLIITNKMSTFYFSAIFLRNGPWLTGRSQRVIKNLLLFVQFAIKIIK